LRVHPLITKDPVNGETLIVTRLEGPGSGVVITGRFSLGWIGRLTPQQIEFVGQMVRYRGNIQRLAMELNVAYNTARNHLDEIVAALERPDDAERLENVRKPTGDRESATQPEALDLVDEQERSQSQEVLDSLDAGEITFEEAMHLLRTVTRKASG
jgi:hypothetical protein